MIPSRIAGKASSVAPPTAPGVGRLGERSARHRIDERLRIRMQAAGIELEWSPSLLFATTATCIVALGARIGGISGIGGAIVCIALSLPVGASFVRRRTLERSQAALPELTLRLSRGVRSGIPIDRVVRSVASEMAVLPPGFVVMVNQVERGRAMSHALDDWGSAASSSAERLVVAALVIGARHGGDLAHSLDMVGEGVRDDLQLASRRRVLLMQATMSALVLVLLPIGFSVVASLVRGDVMYEGALGVALVVGGLTLDGLGVLWMRVSMRRLR